MPFKLKLKKSRHYSVVSKSLFVISVEILDGTIVECTLSSESTGQDCLDVVCQKLSLNQPKFFGLQYVSKNGECNLCWLELDRPIKRQLDKYARSLCVHLRVMYYVISGVKLLNDEVTRYHYFLQLKQDVIEGRISCTPQQAVELAAYSMQAEFGSFDYERHTANYLKDFQLFPKMFTDPSLLEKLTEAASRQHAALHNVPQGTAEEYYICACQRLDGYGQEVYSAKDKDGLDTLVGICLAGVYVGYPGGKEGRHFGWSDISNVINHKRDFTVESVGGNEKAEFQFVDVESAKNAWRFCVLQHIFYRQYEMDSFADQEEKGPPQPPVFQQNEDKLRQMDSYEDIADTLQWDGRISASQTFSHRAQSTSCLDLDKPADMETLRSLLPSYRPAPDYETAVQQKYRDSPVTLPSVEPLRAARTYLYGSQPEIRRSDAYAAHLRYPDVTHNNVERTNNLVYDSGIRMLCAENRFSGNIGMVQFKSPPPYPSIRIGSNSTPDLAGISQQVKTHAGFINSVVSGSSPDLVSSNAPFYQTKAHLYSAAQQQAVHRSHGHLPPQHGTYENLATVFATPAVVAERPNVAGRLAKVFDETGNVVYCVPANVLQENQLPAAGFVVARNQNAQIVHDAHIADAAEPIYENIPLPWQNDGEMRARTQSIHSAPEISQVVNQTMVNLVQTQMQQLDINNRQGSKENLYANLMDPSMLSSANTEPDTRNSSTQNLSDTHRISYNLDATHSTEISAPNDANSSFLTTASEIQASNDARTSYLEVGNSDAKSSYLDASAGEVRSSCSEGRNSEAPAEVTSSSMGNSSGSSTKSKKRRWGILMGRSKSGEKVKSATLGRERKKVEKNEGANRQRWSTGLPRFNPLPPSLSKETMIKLADNQLFFEFDKIPKKKQNADFKTALHPDNAVFNRFKDILPYEDNRLRLTPSKNNKHGYINASHISATVGSQQRFYIAAQGPTVHTLPYFWQCVWEAEVYVMVQLTDHTEDLTYLPDADERCLDIGQDYQIWWEFSQKTGHCVTSKVRLCHVASRRYRTVWHLRYSDWGEQGCPLSPQHFLAFLEEARGVRRHSLGEIPPGHNANPPMLVHCTAGVGRTGLAILSDLLLYTVDHNQEVCIPRVVGLLRQQRSYIIQTIAQYRFVYSLLIHYLKQTRLI